jgi:monoamine oxidase
MATAPADITYNVAVVGAGMAGLYFTWRYLSNAGGGTNVVILEKLDRTGGRLDTDVVYINGEPVKNEEGGMRFTNEMTNLMWLLNALGRDGDILPFGMGDKNNIYNLRGKKFTFGDAETNPAIWSTIYTLAPSEQNKQPNAILQGVLDYILKQNNFGHPKTPEDWQKLRLQGKYRGLPLYQWGFWALLKDYGLSQECMQMVEDCMGFLAFYRQEVNAGVGFQTMGDFDDLPHYKTLKQGYETLAQTLTNGINGMQGGQILLGCTVVTFWTNDDGTITVQYVDSNAQGPKSIYKFIKCYSLVLALPSLPLIRLMHNTSLLRENGQFWQAVRSVTSMPLSKINLYFEERWWYTKFNIANGGSFTDLPMAQFYCYDQQLFSNQQGPASMTIYCDYDRTGYWDTLQQIGNPYPPGNGLTQPPNTTAASTFVVEQAMRQLKEFFNDQNLPQPVLSTYVGWGTSDAGDGDHSWAVGVRDDEVMAYMASPIPNVNVYVCGEAYSDEQAWVDGALRSTEIVLQKYFGLAPPSEGSR